MPIYEYRCSSCGHELEALQKFSDAPLKACPECSQGALIKLISAAGFQLKGTGWYATDFRSSGAKPAAKDGAKANGNGSEAATDSKTETKTESKTESKAESSSSSGGCGSGCTCH